MKSIFVLVLILSSICFASGDVGISISDSSITHRTLYPEVEKYVDVTLTNAQIKTLNSTPVSILAAPGASLTYVVTGAFFWIVPGSSAFGTTGSPTLDLMYTNASGVKLVTSATNAVLISSSVAQQWTPGIQGTVADNAALVLSSTQLIGSGTGVIKVRVFYKTISTDYTAQY